MDINTLLSFFESNIYLFLLLIPFISQLGIPVGAMFFILFAWAITNSYIDLFLLFLIVLFSTVVWDILSYFIWKKLFWFQFFQYLLSNKNINKAYIQSEKFFNKRWAISILLSRFLVTWVWPMLNYIIWFQSFDLKKFTLYVFIWEILYAWELLIIWFIFKNTFEDISNIIINLWLVIFLFYILYEISKRLFKIKKKIF